MSLLLIGLGAVGLGILGGIGGRFLYHRNCNMVEPTDFEYTKMDETNDSLLEKENNDGRGTPAPSDLALSTSEMLGTYKAPVLPDKNNV